MRRNIVKGMSNVPQEAARRPLVPHVGGAVGLSSDLRRDPRGRKAGAGTTTGREAPPPGSARSRPMRATGGRRRRRRRRDRPRPRARALFAGARASMVHRARPHRRGSLVGGGRAAVPQSDAAAPSPFFDLALESRDLYPELVGALRRGDRRSTSAGAATGVLRCGTPRRSTAFAGSSERDCRSRTLETAGGLLRGREAEPRPKSCTGLFFPRRCGRRQPAAGAALSRAVEHARRARCAKASRCAFPGRRRQTAAA